MGNLRSVEKAVEHVGARATVSADTEAIGAADGLILPGVGAFPRAMERIRATGLDQHGGAKCTRHGGFHQLAELDEYPIKGQMAGEHF